MSFPDSVAEDEEGLGCFLAEAVVEAEDIGVEQAEDGGVGGSDDDADAEHPEEARA